MASQIPLLMIPGLLCDRRLYEAQIADLAGRTTVQVADVTQDTSIADIATRALEDAPERFALCGLSMGGYIAFEIIRRAPGRVLRLALLDTNARADTDEVRQFRLRLIGRVEQGDFDGAVQELLPRFTHPDRYTDAPLINTIKAMASTVGGEGFMRQQRAIISRVDSRPSLAAISCPTLVMCGREDAVTPLEFSLEMAANIPNATLTVIPRCGHLSTLERPRAVSSQLSIWLEG